MNQILSRISVIKINFIRILDHFYREVTGRPILRHSEITPNLYLGGQYGVHGLKQLKKFQITAIVNMRNKPIPPWIKQDTFKTLHLPTTDNTPPTLENLRQGIIFINEEIKNGGKVYVHCRWGEGRGPSMVIAYLMSTGLTYEDAHALVKKIRLFIALNKAQITQLKKLEKELIQ